MPPQPALPPRLARAVSAQTICSALGAALVWGSLNVMIAAMADAATSTSPADAVTPQQIATPFPGCAQMDNSLRTICMTNMVASSEQEVERRYQDALRIRRGRAEERRANSGDTALIDDDLPLLIESQNQWKQDYEQRCNAAQTGQSARLACQYGMLQDRLRELRQMN